MALRTDDFYRKMWLLTANGSETLIGPCSHLVAYDTALRLGVVASPSGFGTDQRRKAWKLPQGWKLAETPARLTAPAPAAEASP